ncbi:Outer membrane protein beta-barrel domain-containing protein [Paracoccus isoporae]|uniref:Outer membrane protein beta-barrel domain-containing protein n=1 Tax=Paracoccus isoporae TaxID=591205 RepID=A0A1G7DFT4_9RHOB|nr:outer membrane beta-barrel protein [Paracoccus isoporae]SDE50392.1 Outer membrane protein beta-barrel domain-containing protein [Paracoccus isoporae]
MKKQVILGAAVLALSAGSVLAQEWTGFYAGAGIGRAEVDPGAAANKEDATAYGIHAGYRHDLGRWVLGGELEHDWTDIELAPGAITVDRVMRVKASAGYDLGQTLLYATAGAAQVDVDGLGDDWGSFYGIGAAYAVSPRGVVSLELLEHEFDDIGDSGVDAEAWSGGLRASWRF